MARVVPAAMKAAVISGAFYPVVLMHIDWPSGPIRVHSGIGDLSFDGDTYLGVGGTGFVSLPPAAMGLGQETGEVVVGGLPGVIDAMLAEDAAGSLIEVWFGTLAGRTPAALLADPVRVFTGTVDEAGDSITDDAHQGTLGIISGPSQMSAGSPFHSFEDQQAIDATDTAGRWVRTALSSTLAETPKW